jgi:beta-glucosidase
MKLSKYRTQNSLKLFAFIAVLTALNAVSAQSRADKFVDSLMQLMTIQEKVGQLNLPSVGFDVTGPVVSQGVDEKLSKGLVGGVFNTFTPVAVKKLQEKAIAGHRLHIPLLFGYDVIHGHRTIFPIPLALSCTWNLGAVEQMAKVSAMEATADGLNWTFSPMVDIARDPRWGRVSECGGEDVYLGSRIAEAMVRGYQGTSLNNATNLMACVKHFALYGGAEAGRDYNTVDMSLYKMFNDYLPPYQAAVNAGVATVMTSFNDVNGVPATCNPFLLDTVLKKKWGFKGMVVTDYTAINELMNHGMGNEKTVAKRALEAGADMDMVGELYLNHLEGLLRDGKLNMAYIDRSCRNILMSKYKLGLFNDPYRGLDEKRQSELLSSDNKQSALEIAQESIVLLKNKNNVLPLGNGLHPSEVAVNLPSNQKIALIGPHIKGQRDLIGNWSGAGDWKKAITVYDAFVNDPMNIRKENVFYAQGCNMIEDEALRAKLNQHDGQIALSTKSAADMIAEAVKVAKKSDVVVLALGETFGMSGEAASMSNIDLQPQQKALFKALKAVGKPIVLLLFNGRPMTIENEFNQADAVVECWFPGTMGGEAVKNILFGVVNPSGKLTMTFPRNVGQIPVYYNSRKTGRPIDETQKYSSKYLDVANTPLLPFGYGLSYASFEYSNLKVNQIENGLMNVSVDVQNTGKVEGKEVVQVYITDVEASMTRPMKQLKRFKKVSLKAGEKYTANFQLSKDDLSFYNDKMQLIYEPGEFVFSVGGHSDATLKTSIITQ